jgi:hypothetical protein
MSTKDDGTLWHGFLVLWWKLKQLVPGLLLSEAIEQKDRVGAVSGSRVRYCESLGRKHPGGSRDFEAALA